MEGDNLVHRPIDTVIREAELVEYFERRPTSKYEASGEPLYEWAWPKHGPEYKAALCEQVVEAIESGAEFGEHILASVRRCLAYSFIEINPLKEKDKTKLYIKI